MPDILTRANKQPHVIYSNEYYCPYSGWFWRNGEPDCRRCKALLVEPAKGNGLPASENALERDSAQSSPIPANSVNDPETITISLPALRAVIFNAIDAKTWKFYHYEWANSDTAEIEATEHCREFVDLICERLRQLPARG